MDDLMDKWYRIFSTDKQYEAAILKGKLEENNIPVVLVNKQDSSYVFLGEVEIHVPVHLKDVAISILNETITN